MFLFEGAFPALFLFRRVKCIRLMLCLSLYEWRCIYPGELMNFAPFLGEFSLDRALGRMADFLFAPKRAKAEVLLTKVVGPLRTTMVRKKCLKAAERARWDP